MLHMLRLGIFLYLFEKICCRSVFSTFRKLTPRMFLTSTKCKRHCCKGMRDLLFIHVITLRRIYTPCFLQAQYIHIIRTSGINNFSNFLVQFIALNTNRICCGSSNWVLYGTNFYESWLPEILFCGSKIEWLNLKFICIGNFLCLFIDW